MFSADPQDLGFEPTVWTVRGLTVYIRQMFDLDYRLQDIEVEGEISNFVRAASGHLYFTLKDSAAQIRCVMWRTQAERLRDRLAEGDAVLAHGRVSVYEAGGTYQLYVDSIQPAGRGDLAAMFERLKQRLADEGLFDAGHKSPIPAFPRRIGVVTSPDGAALRDILNVLRRRNPLVSVLIAPTLVQGETAPPLIVRALRWLDGRDDVDTIIIARGGGSIEDLWAFNDERVVRAIFDARHPVISGVGHETDFTLTDFVADLRAPTPSAAAELAAPDLTSSGAVTADLRSSLRAAMGEAISWRRQSLSVQMRLLRRSSPASMIDQHRQRIDGLFAGLERASLRRLERARGNLQTVERALAAVGPMATLERGYAIVRDEQGRVVRSIAQVTLGQLVGVQVRDGSFSAEVSASDSSIREI